MGRIAIVCSCIFLCLFTGCETTENVKAERESRKAARLQQEKDMLDRIQYAEIVIAEILDPMVKVASQYNSREKFGYVGAGLTTIEMLPMELGQAAAARGIGKGITVSYVLPGSPAALAGLKHGDRLLEVNDVKLPESSGASFAWLQKRLRTHWEVDKINHVRVDRGGEELVFELTPVDGTSYNIVVIPYLGGAARADGLNLLFDLDTVERWNPERLQFVCANVLVQNAMRHEKMKSGNQRLGQLVDIAAALGGVGTGGLFEGLGRGAHEAGFLVESDLLALYLLAYLDLDYEGYLRFWHERLPRDRKDRLTKISKQRFDAMRQVIGEINAKIAAGEEIFPEEYLAGEWELNPVLEKEVEAVEDQN